MDNLNTLISNLELAIECTTTQSPGYLKSVDDAVVKESCFWDEHKEELFMESGLRRARSLWQIKGIAGLVQGLRLLAEEQKPEVGDASVGHIESDLNVDAPPVLSYYLWNMHPLFLDRVLWGDLTRNLFSRSAKGDELRAVVSNHHTLDNFPGIYLNVYCRREHTGQNAVSISPWAGYGLTIAVFCSDFKLLSLPLLSLPHHQNSEPFHALQWNRFSVRRIWPT